jgi:hypothetical protein
MNFLYLFESFEFLKKHQRLNKVFKNIEDSEGLSVKEMETIFKGLKSKMSTINNLKISISDISTYPNKEGSGLPSSEDIVDLLAYLDVVERANKWIKLLPSKIRSEVKSKFNEFVELIINFDDYVLYKEFLKKSNRYSGAGDFLNSLRKYINGLSEDVSDIIREIHKTSGADIYFHEKNLVIAIVYNYEASQKLGSSQWCISYSEAQWKSYVNGETVQYFVWDFTREATDPKSKIGITVGRNSVATYAHDNNDSNVLSYVKDLYIEYGSGDGEGYHIGESLSGFDHLDDMMRVKYCILDQRYRKKNPDINIKDVDLNELPEAIVYMDLHEIPREQLLDILVKKPELVKHDNNLYIWLHRGSHLLLKHIWENIDPSLLKEAPMMYYLIIKQSPRLDIFLEISNMVGVYDASEEVRKIFKDSLEERLYVGFDDFKDACERVDFNYINLLQFPKYLKMIDEEVLITYIDNLNGDDRKIYDNLVSKISDRDTKHYLKYLASKDARELNEMDVYVFAASDKFEENEDGSFRKLLNIETLVKIDPKDPNVSSMISMMKMRATLQQTVVYFIKTIPGLMFGGKETIYGSELTEEELDLINKHKTKL